MIGDPTTVEARFGLGDCRPTDTGNRCIQRVPAWGLDAEGRPRAAVLMVLADHILGELPYMRRPRRTWSLTTELTLDIIGQLPRADTLVAEGSEIAQGEQSFIRCHITDPAGTIVAVGTARMAFVSAAAGEPVADTSAESSEVSKAIDIDTTLGLDYRRLAEGVEVSMAEPGRWVNAFGIMHGGVSACLTELVASAAIAERNPDLSTAHVHTNYLRPVLASAPLTAVARSFHVGRSSAVVEVLGRSGGARCTVSTVTARLARTRSGS